MRLAAPAQITQKCAFYTRLSERCRGPTASQSLPLTTSQHTQRPADYSCQNIDVLRKFRVVWPVAAIVVVVICTAWPMWIIWRSPHRSEFEAFGSFAAPIIGAAVSLIIYVAKIRQQPADQDGVSIDEVADRLIDAVRQQWTNAAVDRRLLQPEPIPLRWERSSQPIAGPVSAAASSRQLPPLPGLTTVQPWQLQSGGLSDLHTLYGGLGSGRIVIVGAPGSGKSGSAVLLILAALAHREQLHTEDRLQVPVPLMFTFHGWDPHSQRLGDWLAGRLQETYPLFAGKAGKRHAAQLVEAGRIALILDGLDEIAEELRPVALQALSQQANFRVVILSRSAEMAAAARQAFLEGAVALELQAVDPAAADEYLTRVQLDPPPSGWRELTCRLRREPDGAIAKALSNPLTLTLIRDTYRFGDDIHEFLSFCDAVGDVSGEDIQDYLIDRVLPAAYTARPGEAAPRYDLEKACHTLGHIAAQMNKDNTRDLAWWLIPALAPRVPRIVVTGLIVGLVFALAGWLVTAFTLAGWLLGFALGLVGGLTAGLISGRSRSAPHRVVHLHWRRLLNRSSLIAGLLIGLTFGLMIALLFRFWIGPGSALVSAIGGGLVIGLGFAFVSGLQFSQPEHGADDGSSFRPRDSWQRDKAFARTLGLLVGIVFWLGFWVVLTIAVALGFGFAVGGIAGIAFGITLGLSYSQTWMASLAFAQLARRWHTPLRLLDFLDDAHARDVLRTVGPVYQFRHARLHDRLASQESTHACANLTSD